MLQLQLISMDLLIRLSNAFTRVEARLSTLVNEHGYEKGVTALLIPEHNNWIVTMWHFGADALIEYTGEKFSCTWEVGNNALVRVYSKEMEKDNKIRLRLERQEYPKQSWADAIEEKLEQRSSYLP
jgi:hypothetical protein